MNGVRLAICAYYLIRTCIVGVGMEKKGPPQSSPSSLNRLSNVHRRLSWDHGDGLGAGKTGWPCHDGGPWQNKEGGPWYYGGDWADKKGEHQLQAGADTNCSLNVYAFFRSSFGSHALPYTQKQAFESQHFTSVRRLTLCLV